MPLASPFVVGVALTFGSFGDILEAARIAKRIIDTLRKTAGSSHRRHQLVAALEGLCEDMSKLTLVFGQGHFTDRLWAEVELCRSLLADFAAKIKSYEAAAAGFGGFLRKSWMAAMEEKEITAWKAQISERRAVLRELLSSSNSIKLHEVGEQLGRVGSQVQYIGSRVNSVEAVISSFLSAQVSQRGGEIRDAMAEIRQLGTAVQQLFAQMSLHDIRDPVFCVVDPIGRSIPVPLAYLTTFEDLHRILQAYLFNSPEAGRSYIDRGDYSIVSADGDVIPYPKVCGRVSPSTQIHISIIKRTVRPRTPRQMCPECSRTSAEAKEDSWVECTERTCGARYQLSSVPWILVEAAASEPDTPGFEEVAELQTHHEVTETFRMVQIVHEGSVGFHGLSR
ncbi:hypothetical protein FB45DRAFT_523951 [Roridomyces roridus]|uniref:Ubiquitin-like domain-containing protein n=1 Tax=Roridomyces roridus TaxID=1738132 RepID=A0AAD7BZ60_9AGAR|nr:hypothetical protein FB45DRAFT_523951 [Roridomyces roridus]